MALPDLPIDPDGTYGSTGGSQPQPTGAFYDKGDFYIYLNDGLRHPAPAYIAEGYQDLWEVDLSYEDPGGYLVNLILRITFDTGYGAIRYFNYDGDLVDKAGKKMDFNANFILTGANPPDPFHPNAIVLADLSWGRVGQRNYTLTADDKNYLPLTQPGGTHLLEVDFTPWFDITKPDARPPASFPITFISDVQYHAPRVRRAGLNIYTENGWQLIGPLLQETPEEAAITLYQDGELGPFKLNAFGNEVGWRDGVVMQEDRNAFHRAAYYNGNDFPGAPSTPLKVWDGTEWRICVWMRDSISAN
jgi:hypothetical protein